MAWSEYRDGAWSAKKLADKVIYSSGFFIATEHFFTGWVTQSNHLRIALQTVKNESTDAPEYGYIGYFYFDLDSRKFLV
jgi:hypothetical protein